MVIVVARGVTHHYVGMTMVTKQLTTTDSSKCQRWVHYL